MKYGNSFFMELTRKITRDYDADVPQMSDQCFRLFVYLNELEQRYTSSHRSWFFASDESIAVGLGWSLSKLARAKSELKDYDELVEIGYAHWRDEYGKLSSKKVTRYRILV